MHFVAHEISAVGLSIRIYDAVNHRATTHRPRLLAQAILSTETTDTCVPFTTLQSVRLVICDAQHTIHDEVVRGQPHLTRELVVAAIERVVKIVPATIISTNKLRDYRTADRDTEDYVYIPEFIQRVMAGQQMVTYESFARHFAVVESLAKAYLFDNEGRELTMTPADMLISTAVSSPMLPIPRMAARFDEARYYRYIARVDLYGHHFSASIAEIKDVARMYYRDARGKACESWGHRNAAGYDLLL